MGLELLTKARVTTIDINQHDADQPDPAPITA